MLKIFKAYTQAKIMKKSGILFGLLICPYDVHRLELQMFLIFGLRI